MRTTTKYPNSVKKTMEKLGQDMKEARLRRRITKKIMSDRAGINYITLTKVESGSPTVSLGIYAKVLFVLGLLDNLYNIADISKDKLGTTLEAERLPKRIRYKRGEK